MWYVVQTTSGEEQTTMDVCRARLNPLLYKEMFVPMYIDKMHFRKQWHDVKRVLFPGYFFVDTEDICTVLKGLEDVSRITKVLKSADIVSPIRKEEQKFLNSMMNEEHIVECSTGFIVGDRICITDGPLRNHYGFIKKIDRHRRIARLEINFFGRMTPVEVGLEILVRLTEEQFNKLKRDKLETYATGTKAEESAQIKEPEYSKEKLVKVKSGVFAGMQGILLSTNEKENEWRVRIELFEYPTEVVFSKQEIVL